MSEPRTLMDVLDSGFDDWADGHLIALLLPQDLARWLESQRQPHEKSTAETVLRILKGVKG